MKSTAAECLEMMTAVAGGSFEKVIGGRIGR